MVTVVSALGAAQYAINENWSGVAMTVVNATRATALTYISDENKLARNVAAGLLATTGVGLVLGTTIFNPVAS